MTGQHHRPVLQPSSSFDWIIGSDEAGAAQRLAQETSWALLDRVRSVADHEVVERVVGLASGEGIDDIAELWADSSAHSLAGQLWRIYLLRRITHADPEGTAIAAASSAMTMHLADPDPHGQYVADGDVLNGGNF